MCRWVGHLNDQHLPMVACCHWICKRLKRFGKYWTTRGPRGRLGAPCFVAETARTAIAVWST